MPVPVPRLHKPVAHPVLKQLNCSDSHLSPFQHLTRTLPLSPTGPPPAYGTREQWISSLPTWRRTKPRRIWEDDTAPQGFCKGLAAAANAPAIKGAHAEAYIPPLFCSSQPLAQLPAAPFDNDVADGMNLEYSPLDRHHLDDQSQWSASSPIGPDDRSTLSCGPHLQDQASVPRRSSNLPLEYGVFSPVYEDPSPGAFSAQDRDSSPLQPVTPLSEFVDRAVASMLPCQNNGRVIPSGDVPPQEHGFEACGPQPMFPTIADQNREPVPSPAPEVAPASVTTGYKRLAEPLADWVANYVWKACTTGFGLSPVFSRPSSNSVQSYPSMPPSHLATSVHSLLLSTLLQPSAVVLALWYLVRLPVYFSAAPLDPKFVKELRFRGVLLGDLSSGFNRETMEVNAPFRLVVLGCMLANKWLDDHTFSNKTWHSISNVPIQALNRLESLALDIFSYNLTVPSRDWSDWLNHLMSYHMSTVSPTHPQPISRPSSNPHSIVRRALEEIIQALAACGTLSFPQPVFLGLEERKREKIEKEQAMALDVLDINLDEDGPLREEYLPKRRASNRTAIYPHLQAAVHRDISSWDNRSMQEMERSLPPPARWSPSGDEPIFPERNRMSGRYVAVQPPMLPTVPTYPSYYQHVDLSYSHWTVGGAYTTVKPQAYLNLPSIDAGSVATFNPYPYGPQIPGSHSRSQSLSYEQERLQMRNRARTLSQVPQYGYRCSDIRMTTNEFVPCHQNEAVPWVVPNHYTYHRPTFGPILAVHYPPAWVRI